MEVSCVTQSWDPSRRRLSIRANDAALGVRYERRADIPTAFLQVADTVTSPGSSGIHSPRLDAAERSSIERPCASPEYGATEIESEGLLSMSG
jgi:hypothetical protein